jgi:hypothetical protein
LRVLLALLLIGAPASACRLSPLVLAGSEAVLGALRITIEEPEPGDTPRLWAGEITVTRADGTRCTTPEEVGNVAAPILVGNGRLLFVPAVSGAMSRLFLIDPALCRVLWASDPAPGGVRVQGTQILLGTPPQRRLPIGPDCVPTGR